MLHYKIAGKEYSVPVSWNEITLGQFLKLINSKKGGETDMFQVLSTLSNIEYELLTSVNMSAEALENLLLATEWVSDIPNLKSLPIPKKFLINGKSIATDIQITTKGYGQKILFQQAVSDKSEATESITDAIAIYYFSDYYGKEFNADELEPFKKLVLETKIIEAYPIGLNLINQLIQVLETEASTLQYTPEVDEMSAGIEDMSKFGVMNSIRQLTGNDITKVEAVLKTPYNVVLMFQQMNIAEVGYQRRLRKILSKK